MAVQTTKTNKPINPRGNDQSPKGYNRAALYSGKALSFDGVNDYINEQTISVSSTSFAVSFYVRNDALLASAACGVSIGPSSGYDLVVYPFDSSSGGLRIFKSGIGNIVTNVASRLNVFEHYVIQSDGSNLSVYQNGELAQSVSFTTALTYTRLQLGALIGNIQFFQGQMAGFKLFNTALTAAQVADLYNNPEKIVPTGVAESALKLWLPMMEGAGTTAYDGSGGGNHGTISGATWTHGIGSPVAQTAVIDWNKGTNLQPYSEQLDNSAWTQQAASITANAIASPDGYQNADELVVNTSTAFHQLAAVQSVSGGTTYAFSVYAKQGSGTKYFQIAGAGLQAASQAPVFDLQNGVVYTAVTKTVCLSADIESVGDGWYRCSLIVAATGAAGMTLCFVGATNAFSGDSFAGNGTDSFYFWGTQVEATDSLGAYIPNHTGTQITSAVLLPQGLTSGRDITGVNLFENVRKQGALNLDGNSWAEVHDNASLDITSEITLECWFYDTDSGAFEGVIGKWKDATQRTYAIIKNNGSNNFLIRVSTDGSAQAGPTITNTDYGWIHLVLTYDGANVKGYKNGVYQSQAPLTGSIATNDLPVEIGRYGQSTGSQYNNQIAQPRIYNRALTAEEVQRNYDAGKNIYTNS